MPRPKKQTRTISIVISLIVISAFVGIIAYFSIPWAVFGEPKDPVIVNVDDRLDPELTGLTTTTAIWIGEFGFHDLATDNETLIKERFGISNSTSLYWSNGSSRVFVLNYTNQVTNHYYVLVKAPITSSRPLGDWLYYNHYSYLGTPALEAANRAILSRI